MGLKHDSDEPLSLKGLVELFQMLQDKHYEEYKVITVVVFLKMSCMDRLEIQKKESKILNVEAKLARLQDYE